MTESQTDILVLTETWLDYSVLNTFEGVRVAQTPYCSSKGILVLTSKRISNLQAIQPQLWSPHTILLKAHVKEIDDSITVIGHYSQPSHKQELDEELLYIFKTLRQQNRLKQIVLAGDFNRSPSQMALLSSKLDLRVS